MKAELAFWSVMLASANFAFANLTSPKPLEPGSRDSPGPLVLSSFVTFGWEAVVGALNYTLAIRDLDTSERENYVVRAPSTSYKVELIAGHSYRWNLFAEAGTNESKASETLYFKLDVVPVYPVVASVSPSPVPALDGAQALVIKGHDFRRGCGVTLRDKNTGQEYPNFKLLFQNNSQIVVAPRVTNDEHTWTVEVLNPGHFTSGEFPFEVQAEARISRRNWRRSGKPWAYGSFISCCVIWMLWRWNLRRMRRDERKHLLRDLHDSASADIAHLKQLADLTLNQSLALPADVHAQVRDLSIVAGDVQTAIDDLFWAADAQNENLPQLAARLRHRIRERLKPHQVEPDFSGWPVAVPDVSIRPEVSCQVLYLCNEVLNNVIKHAQATKVVCTLAVNDGWLLLRFQDNGRGFQNGAKSTGRHGFTNMRSRTAKLGGKVRFGPTSGGAEVSFYLPLHPGKAAQLLKSAQRNEALPL